MSIHAGSAISVSLLTFGQVQNLRDHAYCLVIQVLRLCQLMSQRCSYDVGESHIGNAIVMLEVPDTATCASLPS